MTGLSGKVAIVTGAAQGIGLGIARRLVQGGARVAIADRNRAGAESAAAELSRDGGGREAFAVEVDVTSRPSVDAMVQAVLGRAGRIDVLVNNAGWDKVEPFLQSQESTWDRILAINLKGVLHCCHAVLPKMIEAGGGRVIHIASDAGRVGSTGEAVYSAAKGGVIAFTKTLAREMARHGITVNCVCPGPADTPLFAEISAGNPRLGESLQKAIPLRRLAQPGDIGAAVAFLATDEAGYITGQTLSVSGGLTMA